MSTSIKLYNQLSTALYGRAWYGSPVYAIIDDVSFDTAYEKAPGASHTIAQILMHMLAWLEETTSRMQGNLAGTPQKGDWPDAGEADEESWHQLISYFKLANVELLKQINDLPEDKWTIPTNDHRGKYEAEELSYEALVVGLVQHHIYHAGQISLLNKMING